MKHPKVCSTCLHFDECDSSEGDCTRYPEWVTVPRNHYCGEHKYNLIIQEEMRILEVDTLFDKWLKEQR